MLISYINYIFNIEDGKINVLKSLKALKWNIYISLLLLNSILITNVIELSLYEYMIIFTLIVMSAVDLKKKMISDNINVFLFVLGIFYLLYSAEVNEFVSNLVAAFVFIGFFTFVRFSSTIFFKKEVLGEGDFIPLSMFVLLFGYEVGVFWLVFSFLLTLPVLIYKRIRSLSQELAFIPFISVSIILGILEKKQISMQLMTLIKTTILGEI